LIVIRVIARIGAEANAGMFVVTIELDLRLDKDIAPVRLAHFYEGAVFGL